MECRRSTPLSVRYTWHVGGKKLYLWYPSQVTAKEFTNWLQENAKDVDPERPTEQERIQSLIHTAFRRGRRISLDDPSVARTLSTQQVLSRIDFHEGLMFVNELAKQVAGEVVRDIDRLRPAIKRLGRDAIEQLILQIFSDLACGKYVAARRADQYGISKATFTRFAGGTWTAKSEKSGMSEVPDLWMHTAKILAGNPLFMETVLSCGVAANLKKVMGIIDPKGGQEDGK